jgi:hypothetical protein
MGMINNTVYTDYRENIKFDKDNPVLAMKANRDRYVNNNSQEKYAGLPQIGSVNSEDALTWNVFRQIIEKNEMYALEKLLDIKINNPKILLWTLSFSESSNELQFTVGNFIRKIDGKYKGQITEPDVIIDCDEYFIMIECKLGKKGVFPGHLWESGSENGPNKRKEDYFSKNYFDDSENTQKLYKGDCYQLFRMVFYTIELSKLMKKKAVFVSLINKEWSNNSRKKRPNELFQEFKGCIKEKILIKSITWQDLQFADNELKNCITENVNL